MKNNYFFSVIVPCYNSKEYIKRLLESIQKQECKDEIEVLLIDDVSTEDYWDIVDTFTDLHIIKYVMPYHNGFPSNSNQKGSELATGEWLTFIDHDDEFIEYSLDKIKNEILENNIQEYIISNFYKISEEEGYSEEIIQSSNWCHGKFYNNNNFWKKYNLYFIKDLKYCEDTSICILTSLILQEYNINPFYSSIFTYKWYLKENSLSSDNDYFLKSMPSYIEMTGFLILEYYKQHNNSEMYCKDFIFISIIRYYMYFQHILFINKQIPQEYYLKIQKLYKDYKNIFNINSDEEFWAMFRTEKYLILYINTVKEALDQLPCLEEVSFKDWMNNYIITEDNNEY